MSIKIVNSGEEYEAMVELRKELAQCINKVFEKTHPGVTPQMVGCLLSIMAGEAYSQDTVKNPLLVAEMVGINAIEGMGYRELSTVLGKALAAKRQYFPKNTEGEGDR